MDCSKCASLCCIAPTIITGSENQWRWVRRVVKEVNERCTHLSQAGSCTIHSHRTWPLSVCSIYTCKWFWPLLTEYLEKNGNLKSDGTLDEVGMRLFSLLNAMLQLSNWWTTDLHDALEYYKEHKSWPDWMLSDDYWKYLFWGGLLRTNPRNKWENHTSNKWFRWKIIRIVSWFF